MISHGHTKREVLYECSREEARLFLEKILQEKCNAQADFIEGIVAGIGGAFGGYDELGPVLRELRG